MAISHNPAHVQDARQDLLSYYRGKPRIEALIKSLAGDSGAQQMEDDFRDLRDYHVLSNAIGDQLDQWGRLADEPRGQLSDPDYRRFIEARIQANYSEGRRDELISIFAFITDATAVRYFDLYPAAFDLTAFTSSDLSAPVRSRVRGMMTDIKPGGVHLSLTEAPDSQWLELSGNYGLNNGLLSRTI